MDGKKQNRRMFYGKLFDLLDEGERRRLYFVLAMLVVSGIADTVGVASILPFMTAVSDPAALHDTALYRRLDGIFGFESDQEFLLTLGLGVFCVILAGFLIRVTTLYLVARFAHGRNRSISTRLMATYLHQPYTWFIGRHSSNLGKTVLFEVDRVVGEALIPAMRILSHTISFLFLFTLLLIVDPLATAIVAGVVVLAYAAIFFVSRRFLSRIGSERARANTDRYKISQDAFGGIKDVKVMGLEGVFLDRFSTPSAQLARLATRAQVLGETPRYILETIAFGGLVVTVLVMILRSSGGIAEVVPTLGVFAFAALRMFPGAQQIYHSLSQIRFAEAMLDSVHADLTGLSPPPARARAAEGPRGGRMPLAQGIRLEGIRYGYPGTERPALEDLSLFIPARHTVGIVGGTGSGKTTTIDIILGLLDPAAGRVTVDGADTGGANRRPWQRTIGYVPQQIFLIDDSIAANIAFGIPPEARDPAALERAARLAELHDFIRTDLPQGYETAVGERGVRLSGGQRQRIGIARALYHDPDVLIFDEATSALDNLTERAVMEAVHNLGHQKTIVMIAHRLSTVRNCDTIFLLEKGRLAAEGSYDDLVAGNETFRRMALDKG